MSRLFGKRVPDGRTRSRPATPPGVSSPTGRNGSRADESLSLQLAKAAIGSRQGELMSLVLRNSPALMSTRLLGALLVNRCQCL
jgi:hypothetical protein